MILPPEAWMDLRRFKPLRDAGATWKEIAEEPGLDPRTVKKYLNGPAVPPSAPRRIGTQPRLIEHLAPVGAAWLDRRHRSAGHGDPRTTRGRARLPGLLSAGEAVCGPGAA